MKCSLQQPATVPERSPLGTQFRRLWHKRLQSKCKTATGLLIARAIYSQQQPHETSSNDLGKEQGPEAMKCRTGRF